jgi:hypothetical protein
MDGSRKFRLTKDPPLILGWVEGMLKATQTLLSDPMY